MSPVSPHSLHEYTGTVRLVSRKTRVVEVLGPVPLGSRRPTDRELLFDRLGDGYGELVAGAYPVGICFQADGRKAKFLVEDGPRGDALLELLGQHPEAPVRLARPYGPKGWLVEG